MNDLIHDPADPGTATTVRVDLFVCRTLPESGEPNEIIGYWPARVLEQIKERGSYPMVRFMWQEDFELLAGARAAQIASRVAMTHLAESSTSPECMTPAGYAKYQGVSRSTVYEWMKNPKFPRRRGCRGGKSIPVKEADEFLKLGGLLRGKKGGRS